MAIIGNFIGWGIPILLALGLLILIFYGGRKFEREKARQKEAEQVEEAKILEIEVAKDKLDKVMGIDNRSPEEWSATFRRKWLEREIPKPEEKNDEV